LFKDWGAKCFHLATGRAKMNNCDALLPIRGDLNSDCYRSRKQVAVCNNNTGLRWLKGLPMCSLLTQVTALGHQNPWTVMVQSVTQAIFDTSSKARAELREFNLYSESELRAPTLSLLPRSDRH